MPLLTRGKSAIDLSTRSQQDGSDQHLGTDNSSLGPGQRPQSARAVSELGFARSKLSLEIQPDHLAVTEDARGADCAKRFSMLKRFNVSESALSARAKEAEKRANEVVPTVPTLPAAPVVPALLKTAPTTDFGVLEPGEEVHHDTIVEPTARRSLFKRTMSRSKTDEHAVQKSRKSLDEKRIDKSKSRMSMEEQRVEKRSLRWRKLQGRSTGLEDLQRLANAHVAAGVPPPSYGDETNSALAIPVTDPRISESTASEGSHASSDHLYGATTTTTHTVSTHTTFFRIPRHNKNRNSLFPLPVKLPPPDPAPHEAVERTTPRASVSEVSVLPAQDQTSKPLSRDGALQRRHTESPSRKGRAPIDPAMARPTLSFAVPRASLTRNDSEASRASSPSSPLAPPRFGLRDRASTQSSRGRDSTDMSTPPLVGGSGRNSTSTNGRSSFGTLLNITRFRHSSEPHSPQHGSPGARSKSNSFAMSREALVVPDREEGDTPGKYLERLEAAVSKSMIAGIFSKSADPFAQAVLRSYTRRFPFFGEPIDMSLRKFLLEADLPKETQQVDRVIQAFADRYHECNPGIFVSPDQAYIIAFSLMMLHTDAFNKNNKRKMQKQDYIKNTSGQSVSSEILGCFYDNICYTPFVHYEDEVDVNGERVLSLKPKKSKLSRPVTDSGKKGETIGPVDPYNLLVEQKLDMLRPSIKDSITMEDPYNYRTSQTNLDAQYLQRAFTHTGVLQIISQRSRPTAYEGHLPHNGEQPSLLEMQPGIIDLKITKVGTLWRKAAKKKKARSPWQEWGAVLTGSQLYLFKNAHWAKGLLHQFMVAQRFGHPRIPVIFKPPLQEFKPDAVLRTDNAVALVDSTYTRHKNAFTFFRSGGVEEVLLADNDVDLNEWLALINYAAAFRAGGVRIRGMLGGPEEDSKSKELPRLGSVQSVRSAQAPDSALDVRRGDLTQQMQRQVMAARRQVIMQKIGELAKEISEADRELESMLRDARHLLVLAPLPPKTRDDLIYAAAKADASIKWLRRDIWRMKCHKDLLAMDVLQDGVSAAEVEILAEHQADAADSVKKSMRPKVPNRLTSKAISPSPSQNAMTIPQLGLPSNADSLEMLISNDIFRSPPTTAINENQPGAWRIPPLQLDVASGGDQAHRASFASTMLSTSTSRHSVSNASTASSIRHVPSAERVESSTQDSVSAYSDTKAAILIRTNTTSDSKVMSMDGTTATATPESGKQRPGVRRSLQKTLRDSHHQGSSYRHRRGKESDSTVRSTNTIDDEDAADSTPGLKREKGRFILHGKQASVVHFGNDWPDEKMRARRDLWQRNNASSQDERSTKTRLVLNDYLDGRDRSESPPTSSGTLTSPTFKADAQVADALASTLASPELARSNTEIDSDVDLTEVATPNGRKRETVVASSSMSLSPGDGDSRRVPSREEVNDHLSIGSAEEKRRTVIGPSSSGLVAFEPSAVAGSEVDSTAESS